MMLIEIAGNLLTVVDEDVFKPLCFPLSLDALKKKIPLSLGRRGNKLLEKKK